MDIVFRSVVAQLPNELQLALKSHSLRVSCRPEGSELGPQHCGLRSVFQQHHTQGTILDLLRHFFFLCSDDSGPVGRSRIWHEVCLRPRGSRSRAL